MSNIRLHLKNAAALLASGALSKILILFATIQIFKSLSVEDNGIFVLALTFGYIFTMLTELGVRGYLLRELARARSDQEAAQQVFGTVINVRVALTLVMLPIFCGVLGLSGYSFVTFRFSTWFLLYSLLDSFALLLKFALRGYERMEFDAVFSVVGRGTILLLVAGFAFAGSLTLSSVAFCHIFGSVVECVGLVVAVKRVTSLRLFMRFDWHAVKTVLIRSTPFAVVNLVGILYLKTGTVLLSKLLASSQADRAVAYFGAAARLPEAASFVPIAVVNALIPYLSRCHNDLPQVQRYYNVLMRYLGFAGIFLCVVFYFETDWIILTVAKREYLDAAMAFKWYGGWILLTFLQYAMANLLICLNEERKVMGCYTYAFFINIVLNLLLIPHWGITGAAAALTLSELSTNLLDQWLLHRRGVRLAWVGLAEVAGLGCVTGLVLHGLHSLPVLIRLAGAGVAAGVTVCAIAWWRDQSVLLRVLKRQPDLEPEAVLE